MHGALHRVLRCVLLQKSSTTVPRLTTALVQPIKTKKKDLLVQKNYVQVTRLHLRTKLKYIYQNIKILCTLNNIHSV